MNDPSEPTGPTIGVLGPLITVNTPPLPDAANTRINRAIELVLFLALNGEISTHAFDSAFFAGVDAPETYRQRLTSIARGWLGTDLLPHHQRSRMRVQGVRTDWHLFSELLEVGDRASALRLVRGQPLSGLNTSTSGWADTWQARMIAAVHTVGLEYAVDQLAAGDITEARVGIAAALAAEPASAPAYRVADEVARRAEDVEGRRRGQRRRRAHADTLHTPINV